MRVWLIRVPVREKAKTLLELLSSNDAIRQEREKARNLRDKFVGIGSTSSGFGGYGAQSYGGSSGPSYSGRYGMGPVVFVCSLPSLHSVVLTHARALQMGLARSRGTPAVMGIPVATDSLTVGMRRAHPGTAIAAQPKPASTTADILIGTTALTAVVAAAARDMVIAAVTTTIAAMASEMSTLRRMNLR